MASVGGVMSRNDFPHLYKEMKPFIKKLVGPDTWKEADQTWQQLFRVESSSRLREEFPTFAGFGMFAEVKENAPVTYDAMIPGPTKTITHALYGLGWKVGYLAAKHDMHGIVKRNAPLLKRSYRTSIQTLAMALWNGAFDTYVTADGQYLCSASHTYLRGGGTWSNYATSALGHSALETAIGHFKRLKDPMGNPAPMSATRLLIPPELEPMAYELTASPMRHDSTTNAKSYVYGRLQYVTNPYLTDTNNWFCLAPTSDLEIYFLWNIKPELTHGFDFDESIAKTKMLFACSFGAVDARGVYGSIV